jgi:hypothetical protein
VRFIPSYFNALIWFRYIFSTIYGH